MKEAVAVAIIILDTVLHIILTPFTQILPHMMHTAADITMVAADLLVVTQHISLLVKSLSPIVWRHLILVIRQ